MLFRSDPPIEAYELVAQAPRDDVESWIESDQNHEVNNTDARYSSESQTSGLFDIIEDYSKRTSDTPDNFNNNGIFQEVLRKYRNPKSTCKFIFTGCFALIALLWLSGLLIYSKGKIARELKNLKDHPSVPYSGANVTLNHYDPKLKNVTMEYYRKGAFFPTIRQINWLEKEQYPKNTVGGYYTKNENGGINIMSLSGDLKNVLIEDGQFEYLNNFFHIDDIFINPSKPVDEIQNFHIVRSNTQPQWRHLTLALYWIYDAATLEYKPIQPPSINNQLYSQHRLLEEISLQKLHFAEFSPSGEFILFGCNHDLYILDLKTFDIKEITDTGSKDIFNGKTDWVYEEEVLASDKSFYWSQKGDKLIYVTTNDTLVEDFELSYNIKDNNEMVSRNSRRLDFQQYPHNLQYKYPKPGSNNPEITISLYDLKENKNTVLDINYGNLNRDFIFYYGSWVDNDNFIFKISDRTSKLLSKQIFMSDTGKILPLQHINVTKEYNGWVQKMSPIVPIPSSPIDGGNPVSYIDKVVVDGHTHLAVFKEPTSTNYSKLLTTSNEWHIKQDSPIVYDNLENFVYVLTNERSSMDSHLIGIDLSKTSQNIIHITDINADGKYDINFSLNGQYLSLIYWGPLQPWQKLVNMQDIHDILRSDESDKETEISMLINNTPTVNYYGETKKVLLSFNLPTKLFKTVSIDDVNLNIIEILPPNFNPDKFKYPVLVHAYGGPGYQFVEKAFNIDFLDVVSSTLNAIILIIDPRGTGGQDWKFASFSNNRIGYWEPRDITSVVSQYLKVNDKFLLKEKVAIWGWSYGGFTTLKTLEYDAGNTFKFGIAVAPVTNWMFYDSIYTERYMGLPTSNPNYETMSKISQFSNFKAVDRFLLIHGTSDDNVHLQNTLWLIDNLNLQTVENYDLQIFPDSDHAIIFHNAYSIVYDKMLHWLDDAFSGRFDNLI